MAEFSWAAAGDVGLGLLSGLSSGLGALGAAKLASANAKAANTVRTAQNDVKRSQRNLAATVRDLNNKRIMDAAGSTLDVLTTNAVRTSDAFVQGKFEQSIRGAEAWGQASAKAAASGLGGAGIEAISRATSLQIARSQEALQSREDATMFDQTQATKNVISNALVGLAAGPLTAQQDYSVNTAGGATGTGIAGTLVQGLLAKKESLQTLLGSLVPEREASPAGGSVPVPPTTPVVPDAQFAFTMPVTDSIVRPNETTTLN